MKSKPDKKIIFFDVDWTLYDHENSCFPKSGIEAFKELHKKGNILILCTSRNYDSLYRLGTFKYFHPDGVICSNGQTIFYKNKLIHTTYFTKKEVEQIRNVILPLNLSLEAATTKTRFMMAPIHDEVYELYKTYREIITKYKKYKNQRITAFVLFATDKYEDYIRENLPSGTIFYRYDKYGADLAPTERIKGDGVRYLLSYLSIDKSNAIAVGDDLPDISMFKEVGYSVCLGNGNEETKKAADMVTDPISRGGVYNAFKKIGLI
ncbi:MAG: HAD family hydrolase [Coprobacillus sp.]|nr:HAD family hydrolase [Coprobacillus sp.]